jgi:hypothetical protein
VDIRHHPAFVSKVERARFALEQAQHRECIDRAFVRITAQAIDDEVYDAEQRAIITRELLRR